MPLDPLARELVRNRDDEEVVGELVPLGFSEPGLKRRFVQCLAKPDGNLSPEALCRHLSRGFHAPIALRPCSREERA